jgi:uncharacterized protein YbaA (DUF1428 family)
MARYVDGFVIPIPKKNLAAYRRIALLASKVWMDHGALEYMECVGDDLAVHCGIPFPRLARAKAKETIIFAWIVYKSRAHRDRVNANVMKDKRLVTAMAKIKAMPFDSKRFSCGGFKVIVDVAPVREGRTPPTRGA